MGCLSRILIFSHPRSRIQKQQQKRGVKTNLFSYLFFSYKFHKIVNYFILELLKNKIWASFQLKNFLSKKLSTSSQKYGFGVRDPVKTNPRSRNPDQGSKRHRIRICNTALQYLSGRQSSEGGSLVSQYTRSCLSHLKRYCDEKFKG
jgi:hypothetical protein